MIVGRYPNPHRASTERKFQAKPCRYEFDSYDGKPVMTTRDVFVWHDSDGLHTVERGKLRVVC